MSKWIQGYACAVATIVQITGGNTNEREALEAAGLDSVKILRKNKVDPFDIKNLSPLIKEIKRKKKNRKMRRL